MDRIISINEKETTLELLYNGKRWDNRDLDEYRQLEIHSSCGECEVTLIEESPLDIGKSKKGTKAFCHVSCDIKKPSPDRPNEGNVNVHVTFSPMANIVFDTHRLPENCTQIVRTVEKVLKESRMIEMEALCIIAGDKVRLQDGFMYLMALFKRINTRYGTLLLIFMF
jgi:exosome complex RNA-binding protein Rrp42 (RNase PH superfamily)